MFNFCIHGCTSWLNAAIPSSTNSSNGSLTDNYFSFHLNSKPNPSLSWCYFMKNQTKIMKKEKLRQFKRIELIVSENFVCRAVMEALGNHLTNKNLAVVNGCWIYQR